MQQPSSSTDNSAAGNQQLKRYLTVLGTRPEAIKLAPIIKAAKASPNLSIETCSTGQHKTMLSSALRSFDLEPEYELNLMSENQSLSSLHSAAVSGIDDVLRNSSFEGVIVQGDTSTALAGAIAAFHQSIPVVHIEAGLRTWDISNPFPEEGNRSLIDTIASICAAPTETAAENLRQAGVPESRIHVTGNTAIDSLLATKATVLSKQNNRLLEAGNSRIDLNKTIVTVTGHRRESFGPDFENICQAILEIARNNPSIQIVYPVHLNPNVQGPVYRILAEEQNVILCEPLEFEDFVRLLINSRVVLTDSGGIQEEAPSLDLPVLVMRKTTERPEGVKAGCAKLIGVSKHSIVQGVTELLNDDVAHKSMASVSNPYGDGHASERIIKLL